MDDYRVGVRVQKMSSEDQILILARLAESHSTTSFFSTKQIEELFLAFGLPAPARVRNVLARLKNKGLAIAGKKVGDWRLTPVGCAAAAALLPAMDLASFAAEASLAAGPALGGAIHTIVPPFLAPPALIPGLHRFLFDHPFERNVFGMTRFPDEDSGDGTDPVYPALEVARKVCQLHGMEFHLASDRAVDDDLWTNVAAHMWASHYGIAFFEDRRGRGINYNLSIEVGGMLITGRRCALLKDTSIARMPTDLVGRIYKEIDLDDISTVSVSLHSWFREDLGLGPCTECRSKSA